MLWMLLACGGLLTEAEVLPSPIVAPTADGPVLLAHPVVSLQPTPARFEAPLDADLDALRHRPWELPPRMHLVDGLCFHNPQIEAKIEVDLARIASADDAWADWVDLLGVCISDEWCRWAAEVAADPELPGRLVQPGLARCSEVARPVFESSGALVSSIVAWYGVRAELGGGAFEPRLIEVVDYARSEPGYDIMPLTRALGGWDHPEAARRLLELHREAGEIDDQVALWMTRQSDRRAKALADAVCAVDLYADEVRCTASWRRPGTDLDGLLRSDRADPMGLLEAFGPSPELSDALAACVSLHTTTEVDTSQAGACLRALGRSDRARAAEVAVPLGDDWAYAGDPLGPLARELGTDRAVLEADLRGLGFLQGELLPTTHAAAGSLDLLVRHGDAIVLSYDTPATYLRRALWLAGMTDVPVDELASSSGGLRAVHAWMDGRRYRVMIPLEESGWQSVEQAVGLANHLLEVRGDARRIGIGLGWPAPLVVGTPEALVALPFASGLTWRAFDASTYQPEVGLEGDADIDWTGE